MCKKLGTDFKVQYRILPSISPIPLSCTFNVWKGRKFKFIIRKKFLVLGQQASTWDPENGTSQFVTFSLESPIWCGRCIRRMDSSLPHLLKSFFTSLLLASQFLVFVASDLCSVEAEKEVCGWEMGWNFEPFRMSLRKMIFLFQVLGEHSKDFLLLVLCNTVSLNEVHYSALFSLSYQGSVCR